MEETLSRKVAREALASLGFLGAAFVAWLPAWPPGAAQTGAPRWLPTPSWPTRSTAPAAVSTCAPAQTDFHWMTVGENQPGSWMLRTESLEAGKPRPFDSYDPFPLPPGVKPFPGDGIPADRIDPMALRLMEFYPLGNVSANFHSATRLLRQDVDREMFKSIWSFFQKPMEVGTGKVLQLRGGKITVLVDGGGAAPAVRDMAYVERRP